MTGRHWEVGSRRVAGAGAVRGAGRAGSDRARDLRLEPGAGPVAPVAHRRADVRVRRDVAHALDRDLGHTVGRGRAARGDRQRPPGDVLVALPHAAAHRIREGDAPPDPRARPVRRRVEVDRDLTAHRAAVTRRPEVRVLVPRAEPRGGQLRDRRGVEPGAEEAGGRRHARHAPSRRVAHLAAGAGVAAGPAVDVGHRRGLAAVRGVAVAVGVRGVAREAARVGHAGRVRVGAHGAGARDAGGRGARAAHAGVARRAAVVARAAVVDVGVRVEAGGAAGGQARGAHQPAHARDARLAARAHAPAVPAVGRVAVGVGARTAAGRAGGVAPRGADAADAGVARATVVAARAAVGAVAVRVHAGGTARRLARGTDEATRARDARLPGRAGVAARAAVVHVGGEVAARRAAEGRRRRAARPVVDRLLHVRGGHLRVGRARVGRRRDALGAAAHRPRGAGVVAAAAVGPVGRGVDAGRPAHHAGRRAGRAVVDDRLLRVNGGRGVGGAVVAGRGVGDPDVLVPHLAGVEAEREHEGDGLAVHWSVSSSPQLLRRQGRLETSRGSKADSNQVTNGFETANNLSSHLSKVLTQGRFKSVHHACMMT